MISQKDVSFIVQKAYVYDRQYDTTDGKKEYKQVVKTPVKKTDLDLLFSKKLNELLKHSTTLNKLNRIRNTIIKNKCYGKSNYVKQINKIEQNGEISETTKNLLYSIAKESYGIANTIEETLLKLLKMYQDEKERIEKINKELQEIDKNDE